MTNGAKPPDSRGDWSQNMQRAALTLIAALVVAVLGQAFTLRDSVIKTRDGLEELEETTNREISGLRVGLDRIEKRAADQIASVQAEHKVDAKELDTQLDTLRNDLTRIEEWRRILEGGAFR